MSLNITSATIGYDQNEIQTALNNLNTKCITETIDLLSKNITNLRTTVDNNWQGSSAESFKNNLETDKKNIAIGLNKTFDIIQGQFAQIISEWDKVDSSIIQERS